MSLLCCCTQEFQVTLLRASGGARIGDDSVALVSILPNDNPYGIISMASEEFTTSEEDTSTVFHVPVVRR